MEFGDDDDHEEEEQEDEGDQEDEDDDDDEGITIPPPPSTQQPTQTQVEASPSNHNQEQLSFRKPGLTSSSSISTPASSTTTTYRYRECLKNHAVSMGGHAVDGCGEFMPAGEEGTLESFKCAACGCHRNFHRKESDISSTPPPPPPPPSLYPHHQFSSSPFNYRTPLPPQPSPFQVVAPPPPSQTVHHHNYRPGRLALPSSGRIDHYQLHNREMDEFSNPSSSGGGGGGGTRRVTSGSGSGSGKSKRFRTKFTPEQKERMLEFAERVGWRLQKHDEIAVQQFCQDVGVRRQVLKVWMHNNKNTLGGSSSSRRSTTV